MLKACISHKSLTEWGQIFESINCSNDSHYLQCVIVIFSLCQQVIQFIVILQ